MLKYQKKAIDEDTEGVKYTAFDEDTKDTNLAGISFQDMNDGQKRYLIAKSQT